ncbi:DUF262 domain-containing protein [Pseudonocardia alni subsp. carboxydivorans]|uniref:DUF262 domain-containing protein n=1 Tax=Pseudonocardia alni subsp. carboxydivorans TaxID=415010 RepID=A0ABU9AM51_PSEA5
MDEGQLVFQAESAGHLLADRWLAVPPYQRPYAWEVGNVVEFWDDLEAALNEGRQHFLGAIVLSNSEQRHSVIDGQQRLATTSLLLAAIRDQFVELGENQLAEHIERTYLKSFDRKLGKTVPRLLVSPADAEYFEQQFIDRSGAEPLSPSQRRMTKAFEFLRIKIAEVAEAADPAAELNRWIDHLESGARVIMVATQSDADAFQIFETLNDRGLPLTIADLLKNYVMSRDPSRTQEVQRSWDEALDNLGTSIETNDFVTFIRHYWNSVAGATRERELYRSLRTFVQTGSEAAEFVASLVTASRHYSAMANPDSKYWTESSSTTVRSIETLDVLQLGQYKPLLLAGLEVLDGEALEKLARSLVGWAFRGIVYGGIGGGVAERAYASAGVALRSGQTKSIDQVFRQLRPIIPSDDDFREAFAVASMPRLRIAHYTMRSLERALRGEEHPALELYPRDPKAAQSEKILPRRFSENDWPEFTREDATRLVSRIGNLAVHPARPWTRLTPSAWPERREWLVDGDSRVNETLRDLATWSPVQLEARQSAFAELAVEIWPRTPESGSA